MEPASVNMFGINNSIPTSKGKPEVILIRQKWFDCAGPVTKKSLGTRHFRGATVKPSSLIYTFFKYSKINKINP